MRQQLLAKPLTERPIGQPSETKADESETSASPDFEYRPIPATRVLTIKARIQKIAVGKPMEYDFTGEE